MAQPWSSTRAEFVQDLPFGHGISPVTHQPSQLPPSLSHPPPMPNATFLAPPPSWLPPQLPTAPVPPVVNMQFKAQQLQQSMTPGLGATQMQLSVPVIPVVLNQRIDQSQSITVPAVVDPMMKADVEFAKLETKFEGLKAAKEKIKVPNFSGDSSQFKLWISHLYSYIYNMGLNQVSNEAMIRAMDQYLPIGTPPQKMLESSRESRAYNGKVPSMFAQEVAILHECYQPVEDQTHLMTNMNNLKWNGKITSLAALKTEIEYAFTMSNLGADCTVLGVLSIVTKIGVKNIQLADALYKMFSDRTLTYSYAALQ